MIGKTISHYKILEKLGEGGMGVVYKAEDTKLDRIVALKFLAPQALGDEEKDRFVNEAKAAAALAHSNICHVYEIDASEGHTFIAMECVEGTSLKDRIESGPLKLDEAVDIAIQVSQGLQEAHEKGIVHRDIKPANIMVTSRGQAKIMDFGLAKSPERTLVTREGTTLGTVAYMSPEHAGGRDVDGRSDIWSLGAMLYEMICGQRPFRGDYEPAVVYSILNETQEPLTALRTGVPLELERIVDKCLQKDREERYQTAADLIADLRHLRKTLDARTETTQAPPAKAGGPIRSSRRWYWALPVFILAVAAAVFIYRMPRRVLPLEGASIQHEGSIAVLPFVDMSPQKDQQYFCDGMTEELINRLSNIHELRVPARTSAFYFKGKTEDIRDVGAKLNVRMVLEGSVRKAGAQLRITAQLINVADGYHIWSDTYDRRLEDVFAIQDEISSAIVNALQLKLTPQERQSLSEHPIDNVKAYECYLKAWRQIFRFDESSLDSAFVYLQTAIDIMGDNAVLYSGMALAYSQYANIGIGQEESLERSREYAEKALALNPDLPSALLRIAALSNYEDYPENWRDVFRYSKKALSAAPFSTEALRSLAIDYAQIGKPTEALAYANMYEQHDPLTPWRHVVKGVCYLYDCRFEPAVERFREFYESDSTGPLAQTLYSNALAYDGRRDEALAVIDRIGTATGRNVETSFCLLLKYAFLKDRESAMSLMTPEFQKTCRRDYEWSYNVACRLSLLGAGEEALDWLENAINRGFINYPFIQCDPLLDNVRGEEGFRVLAERAKYEWEHFEVPE